MKKNLLTFFPSTIYLTFVVLVGFFTAGFSFRDPDTCWLLASGKVIFDSGSLPLADPFSTNATNATFAGLPPVQYQWLATLFFYNLWNLGQSLALSLGTGFLICSSLLLVPLHMVLTAKKNWQVMAFIAVILGVFSSYLRFATRPEIFSFFCFALIVSLNSTIRPDKLDKRTIIKTALLNFLIMAIWCNTHLLFPYGVIFLFLHAFAIFAQTVLEKRWSKKNLAIFAGPIAACFGTLVNPWGIKLHEYIRALSKSEVTYMNVESSPLSLDLTSVSYFLLLALYLFTALKPTLKTALNPEPKHGLKSINLGACASLLFSLYIAISHYRLLPLAVILLAGAFRQRCQYLNEKDETEEKEEVRSKANLFCLSPGFAVCQLVCFAVGMILFYKTCGQPQFPPQSGNFSPPFKAIEYLKAHGHPPGRMLNEALFGSVMTWYMDDNRPDLFIDGRFHLYDPRLVKEYVSALLAEKNYPEFLSKHKITWVFLPAWSALAQKLRQDSSWKVLYKDDSAVIVEKSRNNLP